MSPISTLLHRLDETSADAVLGSLYPDLDVAKVRIHNLMELFQHTFPGFEDVSIFSTPGRTEVGGNHTDHNAGRVLAAAVDLDVLSIAATSDDGRIIVYSEGYPKVEIQINQLAMEAEERYTSSALIRGICARLAGLGYQIGGFRACLTSDVPKGSGLSSSAAYEVMIATILNHLYNDGKIDPVEIAVISQYAENNYFGKPSGLMDQTTCSVGGFVTIDFQDPAHPLVHKVNYDFASSGYSLVIVETGGDHSDLNDDYAALAGEMKSVARELGGSVLRQVSKEQVIANLASLHGKVNDRAILRAFHFFDDDQRVVDEVALLEAGQFGQFLRLVVASGRSSWMLNQNCFSTRHATQQGISLALAISEVLLGERGAWRVHGGGFAGTIQAFVPREFVFDYVEKMKSIFGQQAVYPISIRAAGSIRVDL